MKTLNKIIRIGKQQGLGSLFCRIEFKNGKLSITGVEGPKRDGNAFGSCGQIIMSDWNITEYAPGWNPELVSEFRNIWDRWHLNDMRAGTPAQGEWLRQNPVVFKYPDSYYIKASEALSAVGLNPDNGYKYGSKLLKEEVPKTVIDFLESLPDTDITPAWC